MADQAPPQPTGWAEIRAEHRKAPEAILAPQAPAEAPTPRRRYRVVGKRAVYGIEPGSVGELALTEGQEGDLIEAGHIVPASNRALPVNKES